MDTIKSSASAPRPRPAKPKTTECDGCGERVPTAAVKSIDPDEIVE
jgi:hypothetical protein